MLQEWIGREETADDEVALAGSRRMAALLNQPAQEIKRGGKVPAHWYVMLFTPTAPQSGLGPDGHPAKGQFLPPVPLPRRMFAGRRSWFHMPLAIGDEVKRVSRIQAITPKTGRSGEMVFVTVRHELSVPTGVAVVEEQDIVYRAEQPVGAAKADAKPEAAKPDEEKAEWTRSFEPTPTTLFRYSAITFNAHRIHYDLPYTQGTEGYPNLVVNGGLTTLMLWDLVTAQTGRVLKSSNSKNLKPLFVGQPIALNARISGPNQVSAWAINAKGERAIEAQLELEAA
ncbi:MAG TPA: MaoC family dehydratase N-terminal domain-containing protein [Burkholderiales bacterium]|jgi:3-methylfumaryl-CoA hydratase|nr:MaoC family dehydratase N-terminal domain-containing protein [Burkholderiales bacterium]